MPNITISVSRDVHEEMKRHPEIRWSVVISRFLREYLRRLEGRYEVTTRELLERLEIEADLDSIPDEIAVKYAREAVRKRDKRTIRY